MIVTEAGAALQKTSYHISVFYGRARWHELLGKLLPELLTYCDDLITHIGTNRGQHIGVSLQLADDDSRRVLTLVHHQITSFLWKYPSVPGLQPAPGSLIFKNFDNDTVHYRLHQFPALITGIVEGPQIRSLAKWLTLAMIDELSAEVVTEEALLVFCFSLHVTLFKVLDELYGTNSGDVMDNYPNLKNHPDHTGESPLYSFFFSNRVFFRQLIHDGLGHESGFSSAWFKSWKNEVTAIFTGIAANKVVFAVKHISTLVLDQLGFSEDIQADVLCFIMAEINHISQRRIYPCVEL